MPIIWLDKLLITWQLVININHTNNYIDVCVLFYIHVYFYTNKTDSHDITELLLKVVLNTIFLTLYVYIYFYTLTDTRVAPPLFFSLTYYLIKYKFEGGFGLGFMVFNSTFNNISAISWRSVLLVEKIGVPKENHRPVGSHWQSLSHIVVSSTPRHDRGSNSQRWQW
jgi:hypothetical protein